MQRDRLTHDEGNSRLVIACMVLLALAVTAVSGLTTLEGMASIFGVNNAAQTAFADNWVGWIASYFTAAAPAVLLTLVVQVGLTIICWVLGQDVGRALTAKRNEAYIKQGAVTKTARAVVIGIFLFLLAATSIFFSFETYFNHLVGRGDGGTTQLGKTAKDSIANYSADIEASLRKAIALVETNKRSRVIAEAEAAGFFKATNDIDEFLRENGDALSKGFNEIDKQRLSENRKKNNDAKSYRENQEKLKKNILDQKRLTGDVADLEDAIAEHERLVSLHFELAEDQRLGRKGAKEGKGTIYLREIAAKEDQEKKRDDKKATLQKKKIELARLDEQKFQLEDAIDFYQLQNGIVQDRTRDSTGAESPERPRRTPTGRITKSSEGRNAISNAVSDFRNSPSDTSFQTVINICRHLNNVIQVVPDAPEVDCQRGSADFNVARRDYNDHVVTQTEYNRICSNLVRKEIGTQSEAVTTFTKCVSEAERAFEIGSTNDDFKDARQYLESYKILFDPDQDPFKRALLAFRIDALLAGLALFIAVMQDAAVFMMTFLVEFFRRERVLKRQTEDDRLLSQSDTDALKFLLARSRSAESGNGYYLFEFDEESREDLSLDEIGDIRSALDDLISKGLAVAIGTDHYRIVSEGYAVLNAEIRKRRRLQNAESENAPAGQSKPLTSPIEGRQHASDAAASQFGVSSNARLDTISAANDAYQPVNVEGGSGRVRPGRTRPQSNKVSRVTYPIELDPVHDEPPVDSPHQSETPRRRRPTGAHEDARRTADRRSSGRREMVERPDHEPAAGDDPIMPSRRPGERSESNPVARDKTDPPGTDTQIADIIERLSEGK